MLHWLCFCADLERLLWHGLAWSEWKSQKDALTDLSIPSWLVSIPQHSSFKQHAAVFLLNFSWRRHLWGNGGLPRLPIARDDGYMERHQRIKNALKLLDNPIHPICSMIIHGPEDWCFFTPNFPHDFCSRVCWCESTSVLGSARVKVYLFKGLVLMGFYFCSRVCWCESTFVQGSADGDLFLFKDLLMWKYFCFEVYWCESTSV